MTSKSSFWVNCRENLKRRSWTLLLCALALFLALPVRLAMELSVESRRILQDPSWTGGKTIGEWLGSIFMQNLSNSLFSLLVFSSPSFSPYRAFPGWTAEGSWIST